MHAYNTFWSHLPLFSPPILPRPPRSYLPPNFSSFFFLLYVHGCGVGHPQKHGQLTRAHAPFKELLTKSTLTWMTLPFLIGRLSLLSLETALFRRCSWALEGNAAVFIRSRPALAWQWAWLVDLTLPTKWSQNKHYQMFRFTGASGFK